MRDSKTLPSLLLALCLALPAPGAWAQEPLPTMPPEEEGATPPGTATPPSPEAAGTQAPPAGGTPGSTAPPVPAPTPVPAEDKIEFQLQFPEDQGGGSASGSAGDLEYKREHYAVLTGDVRIKYQDVDLQADRAEIDLLTKIVTAEGNVIVDQGPRRLAGKTLEFDLDTKTGTLSEATAHVAPDYYFSGSQIAKIDDDVYTVTNGIFTSCNQKVPDWSFRLGEARVEVEAYAHVRNASMRAKKLPVFYTPYILWPVKRERSSGLLIPNFGYSDRRGASLGLAYYQVLGRSYDTTVHLDLYSQEFLGLGNELRYRPSEGTRGDFIGYAIRDPEAILEDEWRWKLEWNHVTNDLPKGMRGMIHFQEFSDFNFFRDFERDFDRNTLRFIDSRASLAGNWGPHLLNVLLNDRETFVTFDTTVEQRRLPEVEYRLRQTRIGRTPLYAQFEGSAGYLDLTRPGDYAGTYGRVDLFPQLTLPIRSFPWLSLSLSAGERLTWYSDSLGSDLGQPREFQGEALSRALPFGNAEIVGPSVSRIFDRAVGDFSRFKHVIEPRFTFTYLGEIDEEDELRIPQFDEVDSTFSTQSGRVALVNRVLAKPKNEKQSAREVFLFELSRRYSFDDEQPLQQGTPVGGTLETSSAGPLEALIRFNPSQNTTVKLNADYDTLFGNLSSTGLSGNFGLGRGNNLGLTWFTRYNSVTGDTLGDQIRVFGSINLLPRKLRLEGQVNYDLQERLLQQQRYILNWTAQCYGVRLELRDFRAGEGPRIRDKDFRFSLSLKNVGTFLDLTSRSSSTVEP